LTSFSARNATRTASATAAALSASRDIYSPFDAVNSVGSYIAWSACSTRATITDQCAALAARSTDATRCTECIRDTA